MYIARVDYRRNFSTAEDMVEAMINSGEIIGICQCTIAISKARLIWLIVAAVLILTGIWLVDYLGWIILTGLLVFLLIKWLRYKPDLVVVTASKTYFFTKIQYGQKASGYAFRDIYRIDNTDIELQKTIKQVYPLLELPGNYSAILLPGLFKKSPLFPDKAITIKQTKNILFG